jgi:putative redox protein
MTFSHRLVLRWNGNYRFVAKTEKGLTVNFDAPLFFGGEESAPSPMENMLASLAACSSIHIISELIAQKQEIQNYTVEITGERIEQPARTLKSVNIKYLIKGKNISEEIVRNVINDVQDNYWSVGALLKRTVPIVSSFEIFSE